MPAKFVALVDFLIITALEHEAQAVIRRLADHHVERSERSIRTYHCGTVSIDNSERAYRVVVVLLPSMGELSAASATTDALNDWHPEHVLMLGIAGGLAQDDLDLGDVVVADQVIGYDYGKQFDEMLKSRDHVYPVSALLLDRVRNFALLGDEWSQHVEVDRPAASRPRSKRFVGPIASGNKVIASKEFQVQLLTRWSKLLAIETEAEGVFAATFDQLEIKHALVIRGISDMADKDKNDAWQVYAANAAAAYAIAFLKSGPVESTVQTASAPTQDPLSKHSVPPPPGDFTDREDELKVLIAKAQAGDGNISVLWGLGGVGKTELANAFAERIKQRYPDAQISVKLKDADKSPLPVNEVFGKIIHCFHPQAKLPEDEAELRALYLSVLDGKRVLLLLDNAADKTQVEPLIPPASCFMLVTTRVYFVLPGGFHIELKPLPPADARSLLLKIAPRIRAHAEPLAKLCGCLPLALRLAGSALEEEDSSITLTPEEYIELLRDKQIRLAGVEASISLSYDLLNAELKQALCVLSVFRGNFDLAVARVVWDIDANLARIRLGRLVRFSLVSWNELEACADLHELVRLFADERLSEPDRRHAHQRAGRYYAQDEAPHSIFEAIFHLRLSGEPELAAELSMRSIHKIIGLGRTTELCELLEQLRGEVLRNEAAAAVNISLGQVYVLQGEASAQSAFEQAIALAEALPPSPLRHELLAHAYRGMGEWLEHESPKDSLDYLQRGLRELADDSSLLKADLYIKLSSIQLEQKAVPEARESVERGLQLLPDNPSQLRAAALLNQSDVYYGLADAATGEQLLRQALDISERAHDDWTLLKAQLSLAVETEIKGAWYEAEVIYTKAIALAERLLAVRPLTSLRLNLGLLKTNQGDYSGAAVHLQQAVEKARKHNLKIHLIKALCNLANLQLRQSDWRSALSTLSEARTLVEETGSDPVALEIYRSFAQSYLLQEDLPTAVNFAQHSVRLAEEFDDKIELGKSLRVLGQVQWASDESPTALESFERSVVLLVEERDPYEAARSRAEWGCCLIASDGVEQGLALVREAYSTFEQLGARQDRVIAEQILSSKRQTD